MVDLDERALMCDFAETYHIYDYKALPVFYAGALASGLGDNSRIKIKARKETAPRETLLMAVIADRLAILDYKISGAKGKPPQMISDLFIEADESETPDKFATGADFLQSWNSI